MRKIPLTLLILLGLGVACRTSKSRADSTGTDTTPAVISDSTGTDTTPATRITNDSTGTDTTPASSAVKKDTAPRKKSK